MKKYSFNIPIYEYKVTVLEVEGKQDKDLVSKELKRNKIDQHQIDYEMNIIEQESVNGGGTYSMVLNKKFLVIIYPCTTEQWRREVINHEKRHIEDRLFEHLGIHDIEANADVAGYLSRYMY